MNLFHQVKPRGSDRWKISTKQRSFPRGDLRLWRQLCKATRAHAHAHLPFFARYVDRRRGGFKVGAYHLREVLQHQFQGVATDAYVTGQERDMLTSHRFAFVNFVACSTYVSYLLVMRLFISGSIFTQRSKLHSDLWIKRLEKMVPFFKFASSDQLVGNGFAGKQRFPF